MGRGWIIAALALAGIGGVAVAQSAVEQRAALARAEAAARAAAIRAQSLQQRAEQTADAAAAARARRVAVAARIQAAEADLAAANRRAALIDTLLTGQRRRLAARQGPIVRLNAAMQALARRPAVLSFLQPGTLDDIVHVRAMLTAVLPELARRNAGLRAELGRIRALRGEARQTARLIADRRMALDRAAAQLAVLENARRTAAAKLAGAARLEDDRALALGEEARDIADLLGRFEQDAAVRDRLIGLPGPQLPSSLPGLEAATATAPPRADAPRPPYRLPLQGALAAGLGETNDSGARARGLTIVGAPGALVAAPAAGRIAYAGPYRGYGRIVIIDHGGGWTSLITGLERLDSAIGEEVDQGAPLGRAARRDPRVTVELRRRGTPVDITRFVS